MRAWPLVRSLALISFVLILILIRRSRLEIRPLDRGAGIQPAARLTQFTAEADEENLDENQVEARITSSLTLFRTSWRANQWLDAIYECEALVLDPKTRAVALSRLNQIAHSSAEPECARILAILIIGDTSPDVRKELLADLMIPAQGKAAIAVVVAHIINCYGHSMPTMWLSLLSEEYGKLLFDEEVHEAIWAMESREGFWRGLWDRYGRVVTMNPHRTQEPLVSHGSDFGVAYLDYRIEDDEDLQNRVVDLAAGLDRRSGSDQIWKLVSGAECSRLKEILFQSEVPEELCWRALGAFGDPKYMMAHYHQVPSRQVRMQMVQTYAFWSMSHPEEVTALIKTALAAEPIPPATLKSIAYASLCTDNKEMQEYFTKLALTTRDASAREALVAGLTFSPRWGADYRETLRKFTMLADPALRLMALVALSKIQDPENLAIVEQAARWDASEDVRSKARSLLVEARRAPREE